MSEAPRVATKHDLQAWVLESLQKRGGSASVLEVTKDVWEAHEDDLRASGDLFFTWQYDLRWAAQKLRDAGRLAPKHGKRGGPWELPRR
jgi:hypothetical protein